MFPYLYFSDDPRCASRLRVTKERVSRLRERQVEAEGGDPRALQGRLPACGRQGREDRH